MRNKLHQGSDFISSFYRHRYSYLIEIILCCAFTPAFKSHVGFPSAIQRTAKVKN